MSRRPIGPIPPCMVVWWFCQKEAEEQAHAFQINSTARMQSAIIPKAPQWE